MEYQNTYIILCCLIIYSCSKINIGGFVCILSATYLLMLLDEQSTILKNYDNSISAKAVTEEEEKEGAKEENEEEKRVTVNPRKVKNEYSNIPNKNTESVSVDVKNIDMKPSPYQQSYEQRKRLMESVFMDLETNSKWKSTDSTCRSIRGKSNLKL